MESSASIGKSSSAIGTRRTWTVDEEQVLVNALKDIVVKGWKCDNGFKSGYLHILEQHMLQAFPGTDLKAEPHISSKIHVWKKFYGSLSQMMRTSGFGWSETGATISVDSEEIWRGYVKIDRNAKSMRYKSWPFYKDWTEIFGKDRATGENAQSFIDVVNEVVNEVLHDGHTAATNGAMGRMPIQKNTADDIDVSSTHHTEGSTSGKSKKGKKRKAHDEVEDKFLELMGSFCQNTDARLADLAQRLGAQQDARQQRKAIFDSLSKMNFLSTEAKLSVSKHLCKNNEELDLFFSLSDDDKVLMVKMMLDGRL